VQHSISEIYGEVTTIFTSEQTKIFDIYGKSFYLAGSSGIWLFGEYSVSEIYCEVSVVFTSTCDDCVREQPNIFDMYGKLFYFVGSSGDRQLVQIPVVYTSTCDYGKVPVFGSSVWRLPHTR